MNRRGPIADQLNLDMPPVTENNRRVNRPITLPACVTSGLASVLSIFCIGLISGAAGGLLFGATEVVVLQSLELLADNRTPLDQLGKHLKALDYSLFSIDQMNDIQISIFAVMFGVFASTLPLVVGIYIGLLTYSVVIKKYGETAMGKALTLAGSVGLMGVTATGYILGHALVSFISMFLIVDVLMWEIVSIATFCLLPFAKWSSNSYMSILVWGITVTPGAAVWTYFLSFLFKMRLLLVAILMPTIVPVKLLEESRFFTLIPLTVPLTLIISDVYNIAGQQIIALQSPTSINSSNDVLEAFFIGIFTSQLLPVTVGMSLFASWQRGEAGKICAAAVGLGGAVLGVIELVLPALGPGPSIGALMGVAGAVGVSLSAAVAATDQYEQVVDHCGFVGRVGVTVGAAVGAFLSSCAHSGLSAVFIGLCAAAVSAGAFVKLPFFIYSTTWRFNRYSCLYLLIAVVLMSFTYTNLFYTYFMQFRVLCLFTLCIIYLSVLSHFLFT